MEGYTGGNGRSFGQNIDGSWTEKTVPQTVLSHVGTGTINVYIQVSVHVDGRHFKTVFK